MKIYTKTGDKGQTALYGGTRVLKSDLRVESYGTIDELNAFVGLAKAELTNKDLLKELSKIQFDLFTVGSESATPVEKLVLANGKSRLPVTISDTEVEELEQWMDRWDQALKPLEYFILPSGGRASSSLHVARTICRRAERNLVELSQTQDVRDVLIKYLNRLSDYLFIAARYAAKESGEQEQYWNPNNR